MQLSLVATHFRRLSTYGITLASGVAQILVAIYLSRAALSHLVHGELRIWFLMMAVMPFISLFELGANLVLPHKIAAVKYDPAAVGEIATNFLVTVLIVLFAGTTLGLVSLLVCWELQVLSGEAAVLLGALALAAAIRVVANVFHGLLYAQGENIYDKSLRVAATLMLAVVAGAGLNSGMSLWAMPAAWTSAGLLSIIVALYRQHARWHVRLSPESIRIPAVHGLLKESGRYILIALPGQLVFNATPFMIAARLPTEYTVAYGLTQQLLAGISLVVNLPITVAAPKLAETYQRDLPAARELLLTTMINAGIIAAASLALVAGSIDSITFFWLGKHVPIDPWFVALYFSVMFVEWQQTTATTATMATGNFKFILVTVGSAILVLVSMPWFIGSVGFVGVPLALLFAQGLTCHPHNFWLAFKTYRVRFLKYFQRLVFPALTAAAILGAGVFVHSFAFERLVQIMILAATAGALCGAGIYTNTRHAVKTTSGLK